MSQSPAEESGPTSPQDKAGQTTSLNLLQRARDNDAEAWRRVLELYRPLVLYWCVRGGIRAEDAEDVAQEVFAGAAAGLAAFHRDQPGDTFRGWLRGITRNQLLMHFRREQRQPRAEGGSEAWQRLNEVGDPLAGVEADELMEMRQLYRRALEHVRGEFAERTWQAFWLTVIEGRAPATVSPEVGLSVAGVRQAKSRVLRRIKQELGELIE
ncbi:MAG: RNA polymerase sigma factor [Gemmataceae bacterium]